MKLTFPFTVKTPAFLAGAVVFCVSLMVQAILLTDYYLHSPFYSGLICDSKVYYKWAADIFTGNIFGNEVFHQAPLYPYFIALLWTIFGKSYLVIYVSQALMTALACLLVFLVSSNLFNNKIGLAAGLLCAFYGALNFYALKVLPDTLGMFLLLWLAFLLMNAGPARQWLLAGCACALLIVARPHALLLLPMILIWMIFLRADAAITVKNAAGGLKQFGIFMLPVIVLVGLVALRNYTVEPDMVLVSSNGGENFFMGNNPKSEGIYCRMEGISPDIEHQKEDVQKAAEAKAGRKLTRARASSYWMRQAMIYIRDNFPEYLRLEALKLKRIFSGTEYTNMYFLWFERAEFTKSLRIPAAHFYLVLPLAIIGAVLLARDWRKYALIYIMILLSVLNMLIFYVDERYRLPMVPFLILLGAGGIHRILEITRPGTCPESRKYGLLALIMAALAVTFYMSRTEPPRLEVTHQLYCNLGEVYYDKREYRKALDMFYKSSRMAVNNWESAVGVSKALFALGNRDTAVKLYLQAFPNLDREIQSSCLRDDDLDSLREYISAQEGNGNNKRK